MKTYLLYSFLLFSLVKQMPNVFMSSEHFYLKTSRFYLSETMFSYLKTLQTLKNRFVSRKTVLMVLDGWGIPVDKKVSAIDLAHTPFIDSLYKRYPNTSLRTSGMDVGLPDGQMGNSEVGHMNLGAGRIVYQDLVKINLAVADGSIAENEVLSSALKHAKDHNKKLH